MGDLWEKEEPSVMKPEFEEVHSGFNQKRAECPRWEVGTSLIFLG